jgi:hypothetical protein
MISSNYLKYRGKCKEYAEKEVKADPSLRLVRGHYICPLWGVQAHWWCERPDGSVVDPTVKQFPTAGAGAEYIEFDGLVDCEYCSKRVLQEDVYRVDQHVYCSYECYEHDVGF